MFAVIKTGGKQFRVQEGDVLAVEKLDLEEGKKVTFDHVLLIEQGKNTLIGTPVVKNAQVIGEVMENFKDKKVLVFKKKRRKQYRKTAGHRQMLTRIKIEKILTGSEAPAKKKPAEKKLKPEDELKKLEAEVVKKKPVVKKEEEKKAAPQKKPEKKAEKGKSEKKKAEPKKVEPKKVKSKTQKTKSPKAASPVKKKSAAQPAAKKSTAKVKKTTSKKEK